MKTVKIGFGGGCHWCTEAVFQVLIGVVKVEQGWIASEGDSKAFSEGVIVHFTPDIIHLSTLVEIHLLTHSSMSNHSMREKYRSAIYTFSGVQSSEAIVVLKDLQPKFEKKLITEVLPYKAFKASTEDIKNFYQSNPAHSFCERHINPKLLMLLKRFSKHINNDLIHSNHK